MEKTFPKKRRHPGFALVVTLSLLVLLTVIAIGLLSLSSISLRASAQNSAGATAKANAKLALMLALGELQKSMGPDQKISANGAILDAANVKNPMWTGTWDSWKAGAEKSGDDATSEHSTILGATNAGMSPSYLTNRSDHFRSWLLSLSPQEITDVTSAKSLALNGVSIPNSSDSAIRLVGAGSIGTTDPTGYVSARLIAVKSPSNTSTIGRYGWWIGDESQKARILSDSYLKDSTLSLAQKLARAQAPASTGTNVMLDLENITATQEAKLGTLPSLNTLDVLLQDSSKQPAKKNFHTVTAFSKAVLADVREGGLKRDLSTILERTINPSEVYNLSAVSGTETAFQRATSLTSSGQDFMLYNFDSMVQSSNGKIGEACVPIQDLSAYYQLYDNSRTGWKGGIQFSSSESSPANPLLSAGLMVSNPDYGTSAQASDDPKYLRQTSALYRNVYPVKIEFVLSYLTEQRTQTEMDADRNATPPIANPDTYKLKVGFTPAMTFWNPNNVPVVMNLGNPEYSSIMIRETPVPMQVTFQKQASPTGPAVASNIVQFDKLTNTQQGELYTLFISGKQSLVFQPGESKVLALQASSNTNPAAGLGEIDFLDRSSGVNEDFFPDLELVPGWNPERFVRPATSRFGARSGRGAVNILTFKPEDYISAVINTGAGRSFSMIYLKRFSIMA